MSSTHCTQSPHDLIQGCIRNDRRAQELLYRQYCQAMISVCLSYTRNEWDAKEILQDGFLKVFRQIEKFDAARASLYTWIRTIMVRTAIDFLRKKNQQPKTAEWNDVYDPEVDAEVILSMSAQQVLHLVKQLPDMLKAVFNLYISEGYTHAEIAILLKINEGTSKWYLSEARKKLAGLLTMKEERA
jgi:RNA polymerase sigma factor (sigma-70 family)